MKTKQNQKYSRFPLKKYVGNENKSNYILQWWIKHEDLWQEANTPGMQDFKIRRERSNAHDCNSGSDGGSDAPSRWYTWAKTFNLFIFMAYNSWSIPDTFCSMARFFLRCLSKLPQITSAFSQIIWNQWKIKRLPSPGCGTCTKTRLEEETTWRCVSWTSCVCSCLGLSVRLSDCLLAPFVLDFFLFYLKIL